MKVFLTGATGVVGRLVVPELVAAGHDVRAVSRRAEAAATVRAAGAEPVAVDLFDAVTVRDAVAGSEAVVHLATNVPRLRRAARREAWAMHDRLRVEATTHLVAAARAAGAARFVKESITFTYRDAGDGWIDEDAPVLGGPGLDATLRGEDLALDFAADGGSAAVLRFGLFYGGPGNRGTDEALRLARWRRSTVAGAPGAFMSSIHAQDVATAVVAALGLPTGVYNVVDDEPLPRQDYLDAFTGAFGIARVRPTPPRLMQLVARGLADGLIASQRVSNRRFRDATGWAPRHPSAREGWAQVARRPARPSGGSGERKEVGA
jgi:nucleoside-diphosphate-sugar epimerase